MSGVVKDGIIPGFYGYEAGQSGVGDIFAWFVEHAVPAEIVAEAKAAGVDIYQHLEAEAAKLTPGESGMLALDWWNGNRSTLVDADLSGLLIGATIGTRAPAIYRTLIEATAFGTRMIIEAFEACGLAVQELIATGGLPEKNKLLVQLYADITGRPMTLVEVAQAPALGAAMHAAVAAGVYPTIIVAAEHMGASPVRTVQPIPQHQQVYEQLYEEYKRLYTYFGRGEAHGGNDVMKRLKRLKLAAHAR
jgi:L-ribulokinase